MIKVYDLIEFLYYKFQHKWSSAYPDSYLANETHPIHRCLKCGVEDEMTESSYCSKWWREQEGQDKEVHPSELSF